MGNRVHEELVIDIPLALEPTEWPECCIYRIPKKLREVNEKAYIPKLVSIGPFFHGREDLRNMEIHKLRYLRDFCYRTEKSQEDLLKIIKDNEIKIRHCYSETFEHSSKEFVNLILLDSIFIIELFLRKHEEKQDYISSKRWLFNGILDDLILLENQVPFFVLEKLHMFAFNDSYICNHREEGKQIEQHKNDMKKQDAPFVKLSRYYFGRYDDQEESIGEEVKHFTDLLRYFFCSVPNLKPTGFLDNVDSATKLDEAGLKFKAVENKSLLDITFVGNKWLKYYPCLNLSWLLACLPCLKSAFPCLECMQCILEIRPLNIYDETEALFRNLMALEQCHYPFHTYICNYVWLMDYLINNEKDVELLVEKKVIVNNIGSNTAVATLFNNLCIEIVDAKSCYYDLGQDINGYLDNHWNRIMASLKSTYFRDFWRGTATVVGLIVLGFTLWSFIPRPSVTQI